MNSFLDLLYSELVYLDDVQEFILLCFRVLLSRTSYGSII